MIEETLQLLDRCLLITITILYILLRIALSWSEYVFGFHFRYGGKDAHKAIKALVPMYEGR